MAAPQFLLLMVAAASMRIALLTGQLTDPRIEVFKSRRELQLRDGARVIKTYRVALGTNPVPAKQREGDRATPEGRYFICNKNPRSKYHLSLGISYPGPSDARRGLAAGLISETEHEAILAAHAAGKVPPWNTRLGGEVFVHGSGSKTDWTLGCVAVENADIEELYHLIPVGTPITIHP
ncbi:MAG: L,D-transpeptidase [Chthoniobacteraceae bacterium]